MPRLDGPLWPLVVSTLCHPDPVRVSYPEVLAAGLDPELLVQQGLAEYGQSDEYRLPECEHACMPHLDLVSRQKRHLVGVACPNNEACWPGWRWVKREEILSLRFTSKRVFESLREVNGLSPLKCDLSEGVTPVGQLEHRGQRVPVIWIRSASKLESQAQSVRRECGGDGLIVLVPKDPRIAFPPDVRIAVLELPARGDGNLELSRGLDILDPNYRARAANRANPEMEIDWIHLHFATTEKRHLLIANGHEFDGFRCRDTLFARLLFLAASRKYGRRAGWRNKAHLVGDFSSPPGKDALRAADKALESLRKELVADKVPGLAKSEQDAILKTERGTQKVRISVVPENIEFDASLAELTWKVPAATTHKSNQARLTERQIRGIELAEALLAQARLLGVPGKAVDDTTSRSSLVHASRIGS